MPPDASSDDERPRIASLTKYIPYPGIPHAGGQYALQHYRALSANFTMDAIAPSTPANGKAIGLLPPFIDSAALVRGRGPFRDGRLKLFGDLHSVLQGSSLTAGIGRELLRDPGWRARLDQAHIIELQWSETASLAPGLRRAYPGTPIVIVAHDVITQRWRRARDEARNPATRSAFAGAAALSAPREARSYTAADLVIVFSDKDADLARGLAPAARTEVVSPGLGGADFAPRSRRHGPATVLFTGAMNRPDNIHGVEWFLRRVWPAVVSELPETDFVIAGASPPASLTALASSLPNVHLTGFVDSLEPFYASADVFVAPLFTGAGVKFKTIDAMLRSVPIVTTDVGAEGLGGPELYAALTREPEAFARGVVQSLRAPDRAACERARLWAEERFGFGPFASRLTSLYGRLLGGR